MSALLDRHGIRSLPIEERIQLLDELWKNVEEEAPESLLDPEFEAELDRRSDEMDANPEIGIPWEDVERELDETLKRCRGD